MTKQLKFTCSICGGKFTGYGNNPYPVTKGKKDRCCNDCDFIYVIPARIKEVMEKRKYN